MRRNGWIAAATLLLAAAAAGVLLALRDASDGPSGAKRGRTRNTSATISPQPPPAATVRGQSLDAGRSGHGLSPRARAAVAAVLRSRPPRRLLVGVAEDAFQQPDAAAAQQLVDVARAAGFRAVVVSIRWRRGQTSPSGAQLVPLANAVRAARRDHLRVLLLVGHGLSGGTPRTPAERQQLAQFAASVARAFPGVRDFIVDNEPNLNTFWMPQFGADGHDVAAESYLDLLARTYDALKAVSPKLDVIGGGLAPRGSDRPGLPRDTHSPTRFLRDLGAAYRKSGRKRPLMDALALHPYMGVSRVPPIIPHRHSRTITLADYPKLVAELARAFAGTAQQGARLPIFYTEFGVQTSVPEPKRRGYTDFRFAYTSDAVPEQTQARFYAAALRLAACQPTVRGLFIFHVWDEPDLRGWQSGLYYADRTPKRSLAAAGRAIAAANRGTLIACRRTGR